MTQQTPIVEELPLDQLSSAELVYFYNLMGGPHGAKSITKFATKDKAIRRVQEWLDHDRSYIGVDRKLHFIRPKEKQMPEKQEEEKQQAKRGRASQFSGKTIRAQKEVNPRRPGTHGFNSYEIVREQGETGVSYEDYIAAGGRANDLKWDIDHGYVTVE